MEQKIIIGVLIITLALSIFNTYQIFKLKPSTNTSPTSVSTKSVIKISKNLYKIKNNKERRGELRIYWSPSCPFCEAQKPYLNKILSNNPSIEVTKYCTIVHSKDKQKCQKLVNEGKYHSTVSLEDLSKRWEIDLGTPILVASNKYIKVGSPALLERKGRVKNGTTLRVLSIFLNKYVR